MASAAVLLLVLIINVAGGVVGVYAAQCGRDAGGAVCDGGLCCSAWGFCGSESAWCGEGCQSGPCIGTSPPPPAAQCGRDAGGAVCDGGLCCSAWGFCGSESAWCGDGCQSGPCIATTPPPPPAIATPPPPAGPGVGSIITESLFNEMLKHTDNPACPARGFYTYDAFIEATKSFPHFGTTGNDTTQRRELAAFFAQTSHETTGGWETAPDGPYAWGYCFVREIGGGTYCAQSSLWPCVQGRQYYGRGPIQLSWNYNYGQAGEALGFDGLGNPDIVETDRLIAFKTALWFWMTTQPPKPSCHDVITGVWTPSPSDIAAGRVAGFGLTTNIINGGLECGIGPDPRQKSRMGFYRRYLEILGVSDEYNLDCNTQTPYGLALSSHPHHLLLRTLV